MRHHRRRPAPIRAAQTLLDNLARRRRHYLSDMVPRRGEHFTAAYAAHLSHRVPLLYAVIVVNIFVLVLTFAGTAPPWIVLGMGAMLSAYMTWRGYYWLPHNVSRRDMKRRERDVGNIAVLGPSGTLALVLWAVTLYQFGDPDQQSLVHYIVGVTCFSAILGLGQSPVTAVRVALSAMVPSTVFFIVDGQSYAMTVAAVQLSMTALLLFVTIGHHRDFVSLELSRQQVLVREREAARLAEVNRVNAMVDPLTGALNRHAILARLEAMLAEPGAASPWLAVLDLDGFKHINDTYGHAAGDAVLCVVAERIAETDDIAAFGRLGGDEFAVLIPGTLNLAHVREVAAGLCSRMREPVVVGEQQIRVSCSIGLRRTLVGIPVANSLERADAALAKAKLQQNGGFAEFTAADENALRERRAITQLFQTADLSSEIGVVYQPMVDGDSGRTVAFEALARWSPDGETWLLPGKFIGLAEATGRIGELTRTVLRRSLDECRAWEHGCTLALNLSARDILGDDAAEWIAGEVRNAGAPPEGILLEITEAALVTDYDRAAATLHDLRARGFRIALDDFGTGRSSLNHVHKLPLDHLKIDHGFARNLAGDPAARAITASIVSLARQLRLDCTIEGIETVEQQAAARSLGVRLMQGYLFGRPLPAVEALGTLACAA